MLLHNSNAGHRGYSPCEQHAGLQGPLGRRRLQTIRVSRGEPQKRLETSGIFQRRCAEGRVLLRARRSQPFPSDGPFRLRESDGGKIRYAYTKCCVFEHHRITVTWHVTKINTSVIHHFGLGNAMPRPSTNHCLFRGMFLQTQHSRSF